MDIVFWLHYGQELSPEKPYAGLQAAVYQLVKVVEKDWEAVVLGPGIEDFDVTDKTKFISVKADSEIEYIQKSLTLLPETKILHCAHNMYYSFTDEKKFRVVLHVHSPQIPLIWHKKVISKTQKEFLAGKLESLQNWMSSPNQGVDAFLAPSRYLAVHAKTMFPDASFTVIPNAIDLSEIPGGGLREECILFVGALVDIKGVDTLIEVARILQGLRPKVKVRVIGSSGLWNLNEDEKYKRLAEDVSNIEFLGSLPRREVLDFMTRAKVGFIPSKNEGFCMVALEYQACGTPVVASNVGALPEVVEDGKTGYLVTPGKAKYFAEKIVSLLNDPAKALKLGDAGRHRAKTLYDSLDYRGRYNEFYSKILDG